jgi:hypothetical protein
MRIVRQSKMTLSGVGDGQLTLEYDNVGEPFREGVLISIEDASQTQGDRVGVLLAADEVAALREALGEFLGLQ